jgi:hypothetical protein
MLSLYIPSIKQFHEQPPARRNTAEFLKNMSLKFLVHNFLKDKLSEVVQIGGHLAASDFLFWGYVKNYVYMDKIRDLNHLKARIREAAEQVTRDMLKRARQEVEYRLDICRVTNGAHVETYYIENDFRHILE